MTDMQTPPSKPSESESSADAAKQPATAEASKNAQADPEVPEIGGPKGPDPTRFGDWSVKGRCIDF